MAPQSAFKAANPHTGGPPSLALRLARAVRTFSLADSCRRRPFTYYFGLTGLLVAWANVAQYRRLKPSFPNYDDYLVNEGGRMVQAKRQELADVQRYNNMVSGMRRDLHK